MMSPCQSQDFPLPSHWPLAFAAKRMTKNLLIRVLGSCETMVNASVFCMDKRCRVALRFDMSIAKFLELGPLCSSSLAFVGFSSDKLGMNPSRASNCGHLEEIYASLVTSVMS